MRLYEFTVEGCLQQVFEGEANLNACFRKDGSLREPYRSVLHKAIEAGHVVLFTATNNPLDFFRHIRR